MVLIRRNTLSLTVIFGTLLWHLCLLSLAGKQYLLLFFYLEKLKCFKFQCHSDLYLLNLREHFHYSDVPEKYILICEYLNFK